MEAIRLRDKLKKRFFRAKIYVDFERYDNLVQEKIKIKKTNFVIN